MKKALSVLAAIASLAVPAVGATPAQAAVTTNVIFPFSFVQDNFCTGELVSLSGNGHLVATATVNDNNLSVKFHANFQGVTGVGLSSGITYRSHDAINDEFKTSLQNGSAVASHEETFSLVAPGGGNNLEFISVIHMTFDATGNLTATKFVSSGICR